jgi:hypothetical protein
VNPIASHGIQVRRLKQILEPISSHNFLGKLARCVCTPAMSAAVSFAQDHNLAREGPAVLAIVRRKFHSVIFQRKIITDKLGCMCKKVGGIGSRNKAVGLRKSIAPHIARKCPAQPFP